MRTLADEWTELAGRIAEAAPGVCDARVIFYSGALASLHLLASGYARAALVNELLAYAFDLAEPPPGGRLQ